MRYSLTGFIRLGLIFGVGVCTFAVWLGRMDLGSEGFRIAATPHYEVLNGASISLIQSEPRLLDRTNGRIKAFIPPDGDRLDCAAISPWLDQEGESQIVGRWVCRVADNYAGTLRDFGIARYLLPSGRVLNRISLEVVPSGHPCWYPGTAARILFSGSNGELYQINFDDEANADRPVAQRIAWECLRPGRHLAVRDPIWPRDPRMKGILMATVSYQRQGMPLAMIPSRLWWLKLNEAGSAVIEAGPMSLDTKGDTMTFCSEERFPNAGATSDGRLTLAYLWQASSGNHWQLRLAPIQIDPESGTPSFDRVNAQVLCENHLGERPLFSTDCGFVYGITQSGSDDSKVVSFPVVTSVAAR